MRFNCKSVSLFFNNNYYCQLKKNHMARTFLSVLQGLPNRVLWPVLVIFDLLLARFSLPKVDQVFEVVGARYWSYGWELALAVASGCIECHWLLWFLSGCWIQIWDPCCIYCWIWKFSLREFVECQVMAIMGVGIRIHGASQVEYVCYATLQVVYIFYTITGFLVNCNCQI